MRLGPDDDGFSNGQKSIKERRLDMGKKEVCANGSILEQQVPVTYTRLERWMMQTESSDAGKASSKSRRAKAAANSSDPRAGPAAYHDCPRPSTSTLALVGLLLPMTPGTS